MENKFNLKLEILNIDIKDIITTSGGLESEEKHIDDGSGDALL